MAPAFLVRFFEARIGPSKESEGVAAYCDGAPFMEDDGEPKGDEARDGEGGGKADDKDGEGEVLSDNAPVFLCLEVEGLDHGEVIFEKDYIG